MGKKIIAFITAAALMLSMFTLTVSAEHVKLFADSGVKSSEDIAFEELKLDMLKTYVYSSGNDPKFYFSDPEALGMSQAEADSITEEELDDIYDGICERLDDIDRSKLNNTNKLDYDIMSDLIDMDLSYPELSDEQYMLFQSRFSASGGLQESMFADVVTCPVTNKEEIEITLAYVSGLYKKAEEACEYELERMEMGAVLTQTSLSSAIAQCEAVIGADPLPAVFEEKLDALSLSEEEKQGYMDRMSEINDTVFIPAYKLVKDTLVKIKESGIEAKGLYAYEGGKEYYRYLIRSRFGIDRDPEELFAETVEFLRYSGERLNVLLDDPSFYSDGRIDVSGMSEEELIEFFLKKSEENFYPPVYPDYTVSYDAISNNYVAAVTIPRFDDFKLNIQINPELFAAGEAYENYITIAHEGFPGHVYNYGHMRSNDDVFRYFFMYRYIGGFTEGWAEYAADFSNSYRNLNPVQKEVNILSHHYTYCVSAVLDYAAHTGVMSFDEVYELLKDYIDLTKEDLREDWEAGIDNPTYYSGYYQGWREFLKAREKAEKALGDKFDEKEFHQFVMDVGTGSFGILSDWEDLWIESVLAESGVTPDPHTGNASAETFACVMTVSFTAMLLTRKRRNK